MSHFSVLVVGDVEKQLAPYHEYESTGEFDEYVEAIDTTEDLRNKFKSQGEYTLFKDFIEYCEGPFKTFNSYEEAVKHSITLSPLFVFAVKNKNDEIESVYRFTNPNAKWDWYRIGGRWNNHFLRKDGNRVNFLKRKDLDIEQTKDNAFVTFAVVKDGVWHEKAEMSWFATTSNEKADWPKIFNDLLEDIDDEEILTIVDCHI